VKHRKIHFALAALVALGAVGVVPSLASAHEVTEIVILTSCYDGNFAVKMDYHASDGHYITAVTQIPGREDPYTDTSDPLYGSDTWYLGWRPLESYSGTITVTAQFHYPDGTNEGNPVTKTETYDCPEPYQCPEGTVWHDRNNDGIVQKDECDVPPPPKPHVSKPNVRVLPACGDPKKAYVIGNPNKVLVTVIVHYIGKRANGTQGLIKRTVYVPAHSKYRSRWFWVLGSSTMKFTWVKPGPDKVILRSKVEPPGHYGACPDNHPGIHHN
jgi:hypothetical protein